jgi:hypothetical protein
MRLLSAFLAALLLAACASGGNGSNALPGITPEAAQFVGLAGAPSPPVVGGCQVFPAPSGKPAGQSWWNEDISKYPVAKMSATYIATYGGAHLHPDFGEPYYGIPFNIVPASQPMVPVHFTPYGSQSDKGPYPIPNNPEIEGQPLYSVGDRHLLVLQEGSCKLYEMWHAEPVSGGKSWTAGSGAIFDLNSTKLRPNGWTSADAAGLPIFPALIKCDEVKAGAINHALRVTFNNTHISYVHPATHDAGLWNTTVPPMGERFRLKASFDISHYKGVANIILTAMKKYGMFVADNGSDWYFQGQGGKEATCWNNDQLDTLKNVPGTAFEAVDTGPALTIGN